MTNKKQYDVITFGQCNHDIPVPNVPDRFFDEVMECDAYGCGRIQDTAGGDAQNQASVLAHLGEHSAYYGRLDNGPTGTLLTDILNRRGVDTSLIVRTDECRTPTIVVAIREDGSHRYLCGEGGNYGLTAEDIDYDIIRSARAVSFGSFFVLDNMEQILPDVLAACRKEGVLTFADMTADMNHLGRHHYDDMYRYVDYMMPSMEEASYVTGETDEKKIARYFLEKGASNVVIKLGAQGCYFLNREKSFYTSSFRVEPIDTTGCGDNFTAGFIHSVLKGKSPEESARFACACGALNALGLGASTYITSEQMVLDFMKMQY